jgi:nitrite reductase/ring-hydroxylating ferredoxin subunit
MTMQAKYKFSRSETPNGLLSKNHTAADAIKALQAWCNYPGRSFEQLSAEDEALVAELHFNKFDTFAGLHLEDECADCGVYKTYLGN